MSDHNNRTLAAIDLGSNSFHITLAEQLDDGLRWQEAISEKVQLAAGLDDDLNLDEASQQRGLACLARFAERIAGIRHENLRIVATNTLRVARNSEQFLERAELLLGCPVEVISGREEARLINLGVAYSLADNSAKRLVVDIGGGSTELVIGQGFKTFKAESLFMGCVGFTHRFFADGKLNDANFEAARLGACRKLQAIKADYRKLGWQVALGSSGTIKAVAQALGDHGLAKITRARLASLRRQVMRTSHINQLFIKGVPPSRCHILPAGLAILDAVMEQFGIDELQYVEGALREGVIHNLVGAEQHDNPAAASLATLARRCHVDSRQAARVTATAQLLYNKLGADLPAVYLQRLLQAASVHEVGLTIAHNQYEKHGAYLLQHADLAGFSRHEQKRLSQLLRGHRRKVPSSLLQDRDPTWLDMTILLRFAVCLHHARRDENYACLGLRKESPTCWHLTLPAQWRDSRPLLQADLRQERDWLRRADIQLKLHFSDN